MRMVKIFVFKSGNAIVNYERWSSLVRILSQCFGISGSRVRLEENHFRGIDGEQLR